MKLSKSKIDKIILFSLICFMTVTYNIKIFGISLSIILSIFLIIALLYLNKTSCSQLHKNIKNNTFIFMNVVYAIIITVSIVINIRSMQVNDFFEIFKFLVFPSITLIIMTLCKDKENKIYFLKTINIFMIIIAIFGIIQYFNIFHINEHYVKYYAPTQYKTLVNDYENPRIVGTKYSSAPYGLFVAIGIYFNLIYYRYTKNKYKPIIAILLLVVNLMMTLTRTIQIAFGISIIAFAFINVLLKKGWKKAIIITVIGIMLVEIIIILLPNKITWRLKQITDISTVNSFNARIGKWKFHTKLIQQSPILGIGPIKNRVSVIDYVDSEWIQNLLQYGIIGIIAYICMLLSPIYMYFHTKNKDILRYYIPILLLIIINNVSASNLILLDTAVAIYMIIGLILSNELNERSFVKTEKEIINNKGNNQMKNILMITTYFPPMAGIGTVRVTKYAKYLREFGWVPTVVTVEEKYIKDYDNTFMRDIEANQIEVIRIKFKKQKNEKLEIAFYHALKQKIDNLLTQKKYDAVFITGGPFEPMKIAPYIYSKYRIPYVIDLRDPWKLQKINTTTKLIAIKSIMKRFLIGFSERKIFEKALAICTVNDTMTMQYRREYRKLKDKFYTIPNGYDPDDYRNIEPRKNEDFSIVYAGKFEVSAGFRDPTTIFQTIKKLNQSGYKINFLHIGSVEPKVIEIAKREGIRDYCNFIGRKSYKETLEYCKGANILLVIGGKEKSEQTGKIFDYMACKRPILVLTEKESEINKVCEDITQAYCIRKNDIEQIGNVLMKIYQEKDEQETNYYEEVEKYTRRNLTSQLANVLNKI